MLCESFGSGRREWEEGGGFGRNKGVKVGAN